MAHVEEADTGCWLWTGKLNDRGYGYVRTGSRTTGRQMRRAHRVAYELFVGPIPAELTIDHLCRIRRCVNPTHLRLLASLDNARSNAQSVRTHCPQGHPYNEANTYLRSAPSGASRRSGSPSPAIHRECRECHRLRTALRRARSGENGAARSTRASDPALPAARLAGSPGDPTHHPQAARALHQQPRARTRGETLMPDTNVPAMPRTTVWATADLGNDARITIVADDFRPGMVTGHLGSTDHVVRILTTPATLRRLFTDGLAQLDAIATAGGQ